MSDYHALNCHCRACTQRPVGNTHYSARRDPRRRNRLPLALFGAAIVAILIFFSSL